MRRTPPLAALPLLALAAATAAAQAPPRIGKDSDVEIRTNVVEPTKLPPDPARLRVPEGFSVTAFATGLVNPRMLAVAADGTLYATRRSIGDVVLLRDADRDGRADEVRTVASRAGMHGIAIDGRRAYLVTVKDVYVADIAADGSFGPLRRIIDDLPDAGQHPNRTIAVGPDGALYISVGSTCNACKESNPENATLLRATPDGESRAVYARGLRNTIGFAWEPGAGTLYGMDHGIDWLGDEEQIEELNRIERGRQYGWPYVYGKGGLNPQDDPPEGITLEDWRERSVEPVLGYTAHSAPMQMAFYTGGQFPAAYRGDAFVAMRGSWNRRPPSGYEVVRIRFEDGRAVAFEPFLQGFLVESPAGRYGYLGRPTGVAVAPDGALYVADDSNGVIYRVSHAGAASAVAAATTEAAQVRALAAVAPAAAPPPSDIAIRVVPPPPGQAAMRVASPAFAAGTSIPAAYSAEGDDASPPLTWSGAPAGTRAFAVVVDDPDSEMPRPFTHWIAWNVPAALSGLREGLPTDPLLQSPAGMRQGVNSRGTVGYTGMKPPRGDAPHRYHVQVFALDAPLDVPPGASRAEVLAAMEGRVLAAGEVTGTFARPR